MAYTPREMKSRKNTIKQSLSMKLNMMKLRELSTLLKKRQDLKRRKSTSQKRSKKENKLFLTDQTHTKRRLRHVST